MPNNNFISPNDLYRAPELFMNVILAAHNTPSPVYADHSMPYTVLKLMERVFPDVKDKVRDAILPYMVKDWQDGFLLSYNKGTTELIKIPHDVYLSLDLYKAPETKED